MWVPVSYIFKLSFELKTQHIFPLRKWGRHCGTREGGACGGDGRWWDRAAVVVDKDGGLRSLKEGEGV